MRKIEEIEIEKISDYVKFALFTSPFAPLVLYLYLKGVKKI